MQDWFNKYSPKEQKIILGVAIVFAIWLIGLMLIKPVFDFKKRQSSDYEANVELLNYVKQSSKTALALKQSNRQVQNPNASVVVLVDRALKQVSLPTPNSLQPSGQKKATVVYHAVKFDALSRAMDILAQKYGVHVSQSTLGRHSKQGFVSANLVFERTS